MGFVHDRNYCYYSMLPLFKLFVFLLDPPGPPQNLQVLEVGARWATMQWLPPDNVGPLPPLSFYKIVATPHLVMYYNDHDVIDQSDSDDSVPVGTKQTTSSLGLEGRNRHQELLLSDDHNNAFANRSLAWGFDPNTTCIEVMCEVLSERIDASFTVVNVSVPVSCPSNERAWLWKLYRITCSDLESRVWSLQSTFKTNHIRLGRRLCNC